jgi:alkanesulfonate monooxygenase SsuD/methylene tetrahydromethanopterin reductase-like flavin-dependent oxidoreductase (luciferase family)
MGQVLNQIWEEHFLDFSYGFRPGRSQEDVIVVRYADGVVLGFQYREEPEKFLEDLRERARKAGLELHPEKTRLPRN